jgi:hypothetical protein
LSLARKAAPSDASGLLRIVALGGLLLAVVLAGLQVHAVELAGGLLMGEVSASEQPSPLLAELARSRILALPLAGLLPALVGVVAAWLLDWARGRLAGRAPRRGWRRLAWLPAGTPALVGRVARWPQAMLAVPGAGLAAIAVAWLAAGPGAGAVEVHAAVQIGAGLIGLGFPLLLAERSLAARAETDFGPLRALAFLALLAFAAAGLLELAADCRALGRADCFPAAGGRRGARRPRRWTLLPAAADGGDGDACRLAAGPTAQRRGGGPQSGDAGAAAFRHRFRPQLGAGLCARRLRARGIVAGPARRRVERGGAGAGGSARGL